MQTAYITHDDCLLHDTGIGHPERASRLSAIDDRLHAAHLYDFLRHYDAPEVTNNQLLRVHSQRYIDNIERMIPASDHAYLDPDTVISPGSLKAARRAAGALIKAVDLVMSGEVKNAFCNVRPPGHHAESERSMGFCIYNNIAVGAAHALEQHGLDRVAVIDFDVHQGNGTEEIFLEDERVMFCSTFQYPFYPYSHLVPVDERLVSIPLDATATSAEFRSAVTEKWLPALDKFAPQMILVSAGFDAHQDDEMSSVRLRDDDYQWISEQIVAVAEKHAGGKIVSSLEGGYELNSLARSAELHIRTLMNLH